MASQDYLIAIALIEQNLVRAMPLGGKELKTNKFLILYFF